MKVAIIGTGRVGSTLGSALAESGHEIVFGSRSPDGTTAETLVESAGEGVSVTGQSEAAAAGEAVVLAVPGSVAPDVAAGIAEAIAGAAPGADVVKAFNTVGTDVMARPEFGDGRATIFLAGDDDATDVASRLARDVGFEVVDVGDLGTAIMLEDLARLWIHLSRRVGREMAFKLLRD